MNCPKCGEQLPNDSVFCSYCGCNIEEEKALNASRGKYCINCGNSLPDDSCFCPYCGTKTESNLEVAPTANPQEPKPAKKAKKKTLIIACTVLALIAVMIVGVLAAPHLILRVKYSHANSLLKNGKYDAAYSAFEELGEYEDAETMLSETRYLEAIALQEAGDYDSANKILKELGDYKDSKALYHRHVYEVAERDEPSCTEAGSYTNRCSGCGHTYTNPLSATGHTYQVKSKTDPTCTKEGEIIHYCIDCGLEKTETTPVQKHNYTLVSKKDATCLAAGVKELACTMCGKKQTETIAQLQTHNYKVVSTKAATCLAAGTKESACTMCGKKQTETIAQTTHSYSNATCTSAKKCKTCGITEGYALGHTNNVICTRCGVKQFQTQYYTGQGPGSIAGITLPNGLYNLGFAHVGNYNFVVWLSRGASGLQDLVCNTIGPGKYIHQLRVTDATKVQNGVFNITYADGPWTMVIEAVGN